MTPNPSTPTDDFPPFPTDHIDPAALAAFDTSADDLSFLYDLDIYGAIPSAEGTQAARTAAISTSQYALISNVLDAPIQFNAPDYTQEPALTDTGDLSIDLLEIDWDAAINEMTAASMPMGEINDASVGLGLSMPSLDSFAFPASLDTNSPSTYGQPQSAIQAAPVAVMTTNANTLPRIDGKPRVSFASHRDYHVDLTLNKPTVPMLPIGPLTPSPTVQPSVAQTMSQNAAPKSKITGFSPAHPERSAEHPWVRKTGAKSAGGATRTGKINQYQPEDFYAPSVPVNGSSWRSESGTKFKYNKWGELDGPSMTLSGRDMTTFLFENPANLTLWIQMCPADSARRYHTVGSSRCRFLDCPAQVYRNTIGVGILRVAIDEAHSSGGPQRDPHHVAGYMHLYCAERFLDWKAVCARLDVCADERAFATEPNSRWAASLTKFQGMADVAKRFIKYARYDAQNGTDLMATKFPGYPAHGPPYGAAKEHACTLTYAMMKVKMDKMSSTRKRQMQSRGEKDSHQTRNLGDLEQAVNDRRATALEKKRRWQAEQKAAEEEEDDDDADDSEEPASPQRAATPPTPQIIPSKRSAATRTSAVDTAKAGDRPVKKMRFTGTSEDSNAQSSTPSPRAKRTRAHAKQQELLDEAAREYAEKLAAITASSVQSPVVQPAKSKLRTQPKRKASGLVNYTSESGSDIDE